MTMSGEPKPCEVTSSPPTYEDVASFVARYAAKLPTDSFAGMHGLPPYAYTGCDYALVLHACLPHQGIDLGALCWGVTPLRTQLRDNMTVFCQAARALCLPDTPFDSLAPDALLTTAACTMDHVKVQHWLYTLGRRFPPAPDHDSLQVRLAERYTQLGEPMLKRRCHSGSGDKPRDGSRVEEMNVYVNDPRLACPAPAQTASVSKMVLQTCCAPYLAEAPLFTSEQDEAGSTVAVLETDAHTDKMSRDATHSKRGLNYSRPWRVTRAEAPGSQTRGACAAKAANARQPAWHDGYASKTAHLLEQSSMARQAASEMRGALRQIRADVWRQVLTSARVDFAGCLQQLRNITASDGG